MYNPIPACIEKQIDLEVNKSRTTSFVLTDGFNKLRKYTKAMRFKLITTH